LGKYLYRLGCRLSAIGSSVAAHPFAIFGVAVFCASWFVLTGQAGENLLTLILSVLAITLTQMVLNQQQRSEQALHMKIDELILAMKGARDEIAGIETKSSEEIEALRRTASVLEDVKDAR